VRDFALPVRIVTLPTVREADGLAMSSRNAYLDPGQRTQAPVVYRALTRAARLFAQGETQSGKLQAAARSMLETVPGLELDYVCVVDQATLRTPDPVLPGSVLAVAVKLGSTRLIDNVVLGAERF